MITAPMRGGHGSHGTSGGTSAAAAHARARVHQFRNRPDSLQRGSELHADCEDARAGLRTPGLQRQRQQWLRVRERRI